jgi:hypothetical protein
LFYKVHFLEPHKFLHTHLSKFKRAIMFVVTNTHYIKAIPLFLHMVTTQGIKMEKFVHKWKQNRVFNYQTSPFMLQYMSTIYIRILVKRKTICLNKCNVKITLFNFKKKKTPIQQVSSNSNCFQLELQSYNRSPNACHKI